MSPIEIGFSEWFRSWFPVLIRNARLVIANTFLIFDYLLKPQEILCVYEDSDPMWNNSLPKVND